MKKLTGLILIGIIMATTYGCATGGGFYSQQEALQRTQAAEELSQALESAQRSYVAGDYRQAIRGYEDVLAHNSSRYGDFECSLRTNLALAYLETGNVTGFKRTAGQAESDCKHQRNISSETQIVLELYRAMAGVPGTDDRVDARIVAVIKSLKGERK